MEIISSFKELNKYLVILVMIVLSGSIIPFVFFQGYTELLMLFLLIIMAFLLKRIITIKIHLISLFFIFFVFAFLFSHYALRSSGIYLSSYIGLMIRFSIAFILIHLMDFKEFIKKYVDLMTIIVFISIIFYFGGIVFPNFIQQLPVSYNDAGTGYRCAYVYFYQGITSWNYRNAGIFWEGGAFQLFINVALLFRLFYLNKRFGKDKLATLILIIGVITTVSTVGIFVLIIQLYLVFKDRSPLIRYIFYFGGLAVVLSSGMVETLIESKFSMQGTSGNERLAGILADLTIFIRKPFLGAGFDYIEQNFKDLAYSYGAIVPSSTNSFTGALALYGFIFTSIISILLFKLCFLISDKIMYKIVFLGIMIFLLSTQGVIFQLLFICFMFYGLKENKLHNERISCKG